MTSVAEDADVGAEAVVAALLSGVLSIVPLPLHPRGRSPSLKPICHKLLPRPHFLKRNVQQR